MELEAYVRIPYISDPYSVICYTWCPEHEMVYSNIKILFFFSELALIRSMDLPYRKDRIRPLLSTTEGLRRMSLYEYLSEQRLSMFLSLINSRPERA